GWVPTPETAEYHDGFRIAQPWLCALLVSLGAIVMLGWSLGLDRVTRIVPGAPSMKLNTAICFCLLGTATWLRGRGRSAPITLTFATATLLIACYTILEYLTVPVPSIDNLFLRQLHDPGVFPGRMSVPSTLGLSCLATSLLLELRSTDTERRLSQVLAAIAM